MENNFVKMDLESYVAKYVDEHGCSVEQACEELEIDSKQLFNHSSLED